MSLSIPAFNQVKVAVAGDVMVDHYWYGATSRISPEAPVPVVHVTDTERRAGGAANVACNAAALGADSLLCGVIGKDVQAEHLLRTLEQAGVGCSLSPVSDFSTITKTRIISRQQQLLRLDHESRVPESGAFALLEAASEALLKRDLLIVSDYGKGSLAHVQALIGAARLAQRPVLVDPKGQDFERYRGATLMTPNQSEFEAVMGQCLGDEAFGERAEALRSRLEMEAILVTRGENGMTLVTSSSAPLHLRAQAHEVFDVTGAGDTVIAALGCALSAGCGFEDAARIANLAAGLVVSRLGAATVTRSDLVVARDSQAQIPSGVLALPQLLDAVALARTRGERVVMTNGCFDLLHAGHVSYLSEARRLGDRMLVALNSDASVTRLKGSGRPINGQDARAAVLCALSDVDWVVIFDEDTPEALIANLLPDVLVKGGDYEVCDIAGAKSVLDAGGEVQTLSFVEGFSTTQTLARAKNLSTTSDGESA